MSIRPEFSVHLLNPQGINEANELAEAFSALLDTIDRLVPVGRPKSIVITHLQEAAFWAKRGVAEKRENQLEP